MGSIKGNLEGNEVIDSLDTDNGNMRGYYIKVIKIKKKNMDVVLEVDDDN